MNDDKKDTKELAAVHDTPPETPPEGVPVADTPENITIRVTALEIWKQSFSESVNARFGNLLTPEQITMMIESNVKNALESVNGKITTLTESSERQSTTNEERTKTVNGWMDAQRDAWKALFGRDITDKDSKQLTPSIFDRMADMEKKTSAAHDRADAATLEVAEVRIDHIESKQLAIDAKAEYEKYKPMFETLQTTVNQLVSAQEAERLENEKQRERTRRATELFMWVIKRPEFWALFGGSGGIVATLILKTLGAF